MVNGTENRIGELSLDFGLDILCIFSPVKQSIYCDDVMVIVVGNRHGDTSSNPGQD